MIIRAASVQMDVAFDDPSKNIARIVEHIEQLAQQGVQLAVFPECAVTGYCVSSKEEAERLGVRVQDLDAVRGAARQHQMVVIVGFAEKGLYNTAVLFDSDAAPLIYRKTHLPELGYDKFANTGDSLDVFETSVGRIGILICFDVRHPEAARSLGLRGADIIALPTNWPTGADISADNLCIARAVENKVFVITANRVGSENGYAFIGKSKIIAPSGQVLGGAHGNEETVLVAELDLSIARNKRNVTVPGKHETTILESRRPELYGQIVAPKLAKDA
jgi:predicted amidohydrolase